MNFFDLVNISEQFMEIVNPSNPENIIRFGKELGLEKGSQVIDFGCGFGESLVLWAEEFGITGVGIDIREYACDRAKEKIAAKGFSDRLQIYCANASEFEFEPNSFDVATCLGATFIWGGFGSSIGEMKRALKPKGRIGIGELTWLNDTVPVDYGQRREEIHKEFDLYKFAQREGFAFSGVIRSSRADWDRYETDNWKGLLHWLAENASHPEWDEVESHFRQVQEDYLQFGRQNLGWALYALVEKPQKSGL